MPEVIGYMIGGVSLAGILTGLSAWLDKPRYAAFCARWTRRAVYQRIAKYCLVKDAGLAAQEKAEAEARKLEVRLG